jgi:hypothetical protein
MQHVDKNPSISHEELSCLIDMFAEEEQLVIFELVVPVGAKVPAPRQHVELAKLVVAQSSVTSTPTKAAAPLRVNNTALGAAWCVTATLTAPQSARQR